MAESRQEKLSGLFRAFLDHESVVDAPSSLAAYECDGLSAYKKTPLLVVLPDTIEQVQQVVRLCNDHRIPIVSRGAGTGLSGGALPHEEGIEQIHTNSSRPHWRHEPYPTAYAVAGTRLPAPDEAQRSGCTSGHSRPTAPYALG